MSPKEALDLGVAAGNKPINSETPISNAATMTPEIQKHSKELVLHIVRQLIPDNFDYLGPAKWVEQELALPELLACVEALKRCDTALLAALNNQGGVSGEERFPKPIWMELKATKDQCQQALAAYDAAMKGQK